MVHLLHDDTETLVREFLGRVRAIPPYSREVVPLERVEQDAVGSFDYLLRRIGRLPLPEHLLDIGPAIGRDRARRGVPLDHLLTAVRLDFRVLWAALRRRSGPDDTALLVARAEDVWSVVEEYTTTIQVSYLEESALMARERRRERSALVGALLAQPDPDPADVTRVSVALDVPPDAPFLVAAVPSHDDADLRRLADGMGAAGRTVHVQESARHTLLLARWLADLSAPPSSLVPDLRCGLAPVTDGLAEVPRAARLAQDVVDAVPAVATGPHTIGDVWAELARSRLGEAAEAMSGATLRGLTHARTGERDRLVGTVAAYARSGSVQQAAADLYCHRNTVVNRLRRFAELTGRDVAVPEQAAEVLVALRWATSATASSWSHAGADVP